MKVDDAINVLGGPLVLCGRDPVTGFFRDGCCNTNPQDHGCHTVCSVMTAEFLAFSASKGNDLSTPVPQYGFPGLQPGDRWCLCAGRWYEAYVAGHAPMVVLEATHQKTLRHAPIEALLEYAVLASPGDAGH